MANFGPKLSQNWANQLSNRPGRASTVDQAPLGLRFVASCGPFLVTFWPKTGQKWATFLQPSGCIFFYRRRPGAPCCVGWHRAKSVGGRGRVAMHWPMRPALTRRSGSPVASRKLRVVSEAWDPRSFLVTPVFQGSPDNQVSSAKAWRQSGRGSVKGQPYDGRHPSPLRTVSVLGELVGQIPLMHCGRAHWEAAPWPVPVPGHAVLTPTG